MLTFAMNCFDQEINFGSHPSLAELRGISRLLNSKGVCIMTTPRIRGFPLFSMTRAGVFS